MWQLLKSELLTEVRMLLWSFSLSNIHKGVPGNASVCENFLSKKCWELFPGPLTFSNISKLKITTTTKLTRVLWACSFIVLLLLLLLGYARTIGVCACLGLWMWLYFGETEDVTYLSSRLCCELCRGKVSFRRWLPIVCSCRRGPSAGGATPLVATKCHSWPGIFNNVCPILGISAVFPLSFVEVGAWYSYSVDMTKVTWP